MPGATNMGWTAINRLTGGAIDARYAATRSTLHLPCRSYRTEDDAAFRIDREEDHHADDGDDDRGYDQVDEVAHTTLM